MQCDCGVQVFKPAVMYSSTSTRQIFERLAHSSIMRLSESRCVSLLPRAKTGPLSSRSLLVRCALKQAQSDQTRSVTTPLRGETSQPTPYTAKSRPPSPVGGIGERGKGWV